MAKGRRRGDTRAKIVKRVSRYSGGVLEHLGEGLARRAALHDRMAALAVALTIERRAPTDAEIELRELLKGEIAGIDAEVRPLLATAFKAIATCCVAAEFPLDEAHRMIDAAARDATAAPSDKGYSGAAAIP